MANVLMFPYCKAVYDQMTKRYGARYGSVGDFATLFANKYLSKAFNVPVANDITFHVRLNPACSAHTNLVVDVNAPNWYSALCSKLNAVSLTASGKPLSEWPMNKLNTLNSVSVQYATPLQLSVADRFLPLEAPAEYSASKTQEVRSWFETTIAYMGLALGEHIFQTVPGIESNLENNYHPDDLAWQHVATFARNKAEVKAFFEKTFDSFTESDMNLTTDLRQKVLNHMYKVMNNVLVNHRDAIKDAFLSEALSALQTQLHVSSFEGQSPIEEPTPVEEIFKLDEDLFTDSPVLIAGNDDNGKKKGFFTRQWQKGKDWMRKRQDKKAERKVDKATSDNNLAQQRAELKLAEAKEKKRILNERKLRRMTKNPQIPPSEAPPVPTKKDAQISSLLETVHSHAISQLIGNLFVFESSNIKDVQLSMLQLVAEISYGTKVTWSRDDQIHRKTVVAMDNEKSKKHSEVVVVVKEKETPKPTEPSKSSVLENPVIMVSSSVGANRPASIKVPGMPGLTEFVVNKPVVAVTAKAASPEISQKSPVMAPLELAKLYSATHARALRYLLQNIAGMPQTDIFLYSDKLLGQTPTESAIKASLARPDVNLKVQATVKVGSFPQTVHILY